MSRGFNREKRNGGKRDGMKGKIGGMEEGE